MTDKTIYSVIREVMPDLIAQSVIGVQPMDKHPMTFGEEILADTKVFWVQPSFNPGDIWSFSMSDVSNENQYKPWCIETFGNEGKNENFWFCRAHKFYFLNECDRTLFILRWQ